MAKQYVFRLRKPFVRRNCLDFIERLNIDETKKKHWIVTVKEGYEDRSEAQNNLYHLWVGVLSEAIFEATGVRKTKEEIKAWLQLMFLGETEVDMPGRTFHVIRSTRELNVAQMAEYLNHVDAFAAQDLDTPLPRPEDQYYLALMGDRS
jgi:hypothetical protein